MRHRWLWVRGAILLAVVAAAVVVQLKVGLPDQEELRSALDGLGAWAVPAFIALYIGVLLLPTGPSAVVTIVGGALLGLPVALAAVITAAVIGSSISFTVGRVLGRDAVRRLSGERLHRLDESVREHGFATVLVARLVPILPFSTLNYAFGVTSVTWPSYVGATALGILPGTTLYVLVGAYGTEPGSWPFIIGVAGLVLLSLVGLVRARRSRSRTEA